ncbi:CinA family nicotinamide mononucleotide deamidase-related protein [Thalassotalea sediminis]|uniref:CinA family nicotinamide mononucleotide deamidase-related protein n=1 Tax=Thalassotalea sediminis TaxID=1759089 RepID=UPI00257225A0|nr:CinA family nicotinamide mononucleotide deamidase-related protein [Thalassotalea sediminis]
MSQPNVQLLLTGDEIMNGDIVDSNSAMIAQQLMPLGINISKKTTVADDLAVLVAQIELLSAQADILIINGGLGPTVDDLTAQALAQACNVPLKQHEQAYQHIVDWCQKRNYSLSDASIKQALLPLGVEIIENSIGSAVGFYMRYQGCDIFCTPGVPKELALMLKKYIAPKLSQNSLVSTGFKVEKFQIFGIGESSVQQLITDNLADWPDDITLGFRSCAPMLEIKLTTFANVSALHLKQWQDKLLQLLGDHVLCQIVDEPPTMAEHVLTLLKANKKTIATAESCTGGLIASLLTDVSGASEAFEAGFVTYSNQMKHTLIDVPNDLLSLHGAVSEPVVKAMAQGAIKRLAADYAIAVSGIAGPNGGSIEKPVGTVWIAWGSLNNMQTTRFQINGDRHYFKLSVAHRALDLIRRCLINSKEIPMYKK